MRNIFFLMVVVSFFVMCTSNAQSATVQYTPGTTQNVYGISTFDTTGADMGGMIISINGGVDSATWSSTAGAVGSGWSLTLDNYNKTTYSDAYGNIGALWTLDVSDPRLTINSITIEALPGKTVFDVGKFTNTPPDYNKLTPNSEWGWPIDWTLGGLDSSAFNLDFTATYSNLVGIIGDSNSPYRDLYSTLTINFATPFTPTSTLSFYMDTDNTQTPEPATMILLGAGLVGLVGTRKIRKKQA